MAAVTLSATALKKADEFLTQYLKDKVPEADFGKGSVMRDYVIQAVAHVFAYLEEERVKIRQMQSLSGLKLLADSGEDVSDAIDAKLSDWFLTRKDGTRSTVTTVLHFTQQTTVTVPPGAKFYRTSVQLFRPDSTVPIVIPDTELIPTIDTDGTVIDYTAQIQLRAVDGGVAGNIPPGRFTSVDVFSPYFSYAENVSEGQDGADIESDAAMLERASTGVSVRNLVNDRSISTVLREMFSGLDKVTTIGFGDPEMLRDLLTETVVGLRMHVGGFNDIYCGLPRKTVSETVAVNGTYIRPDGVINILRDTAANFLDDTGPIDPVVPGHILRVTAGLTNVPREFVITEVGVDTLTVSERSAFPTATDEDGTLVSYTVGSSGPGFDNIRGSSATGETSRTITLNERAALTAQPVYKIKKVELLKVDGTVEAELGPRVNITPVLGEYQAVVLNQPCAQSSYASVQINVAGYAGRNLRVTYETLTDYASVQAYVTDRFERVVCANPLVKGFHPVYVSLSIEYKRKSTSVAVLDNAAMAQVIADYVNGFDWTETLDVSAITEFVRMTYPDIGVIFPIIPVYRLLAPDGQVYTFITKDLVTIYPERTQNRAQLYNGTELQVQIPDGMLDPDVTANEAQVDAANRTLRNQLTELGVSDRVVRYFANLEDVIVVERA